MLVTLFTDHEHGRKKKPIMDRLHKFFYNFYRKSNFPVKSIPLKNVDKCHKTYMYSIVYGFIIFEY